MGTCPVCPAGERRSGVASSTLDTLVVVRQAPASCLQAIAADAVANQVRFYTGW
jgi:hypothetical protein